MNLKVVLILVLFKLESASKFKSKHLLKFTGTNKQQRKTTMKTLLLTLLITLPVMAQQTGTPPAKTQGTNVGAHLRFTHQLKDTAGMAMMPTGFIIYNAPTLGGFGTADEKEIGLLDISLFQGPTDPTVFKYHIAGNPDLVGKDSCYKVMAYQTSWSGGNQIRLDSGVSAPVCGRATNTLEAPSSLTIGLQ